MIPVCEPYLAGNEAEYVRRCVDTNWIGSSGEYISKFENEFSAYCGCLFGISTTSGTTALHLALAALGIGIGDEVIVPTFTMAASAFAVCYTGAHPVFVDCETLTCNIDPRRIGEAITPKTKAIMPVHIYGHPCDMDAINEIAKRHHLFVIEDAAEAHGAMYKGRKAGSLGDVACFSFYANKIVTTGEGGMVVTSNPFAAEMARVLKNLAHSSTRFIHQAIGFNYRMTNIQAAIGLAQLEHIERYIELRRHHAMLYTKELKDYVVCPVELDGIRNVYWMYGIMTERRDKLMAYLKENGIETRAFFVPMHRQPVFPSGNFPMADYVSKRGLYLPSGTGLTDEQVLYVASKVREFAG